MQTQRFSPFRLLGWLEAYSVFRELINGCLIVGPQISGHGDWFLGSGGSADMGAGRYVKAYIRIEANHTENKPSKTDLGSETITDTVAVVTFYFECHSPLPAPTNEITC
jgi:hypothetical protein